MKLANAIMMMIVIQATTLLYDQVFSNDYTLSSYGSNETTIWNFVSNPTSWSATGFLVVLAGLVAVGGLIGVGVYLVTKSDTALFYPVFTLLIGVGTIPMKSLYDVFTRDPALFGCEVWEICPLGLFTWIFIGGLFGLYYVLACLEWWSGRSTG